MNKHIPSFDDFVNESKEIKIGTKLSFAGAGDGKVVKIGSAADIKSSYKKIAKGVDFDKLDTDNLVAILYKDGVVNVMTMNDLKASKTVKVQNG